MNLLFIYEIDLIALLLVAHWLERWCASLAAQVQFLACPVQRQLLQGETPSCCCHPPLFVNYMLINLSEQGQGVCGYADDYLKHIYISNTWGRIWLEF